MTYNEFESQFKPQINNIRSFKGRLDFANQYLNRIGSGSGRAVYDIDGEKVLKLAKNEKGISQNQVENDYVMQRSYDNIITIVFDASHDNTWIVAEKAKKITPNRFRELTGYKVQDVGDYLGDYKRLSNGQKPVFLKDQEIKNKMDNDEYFISQIAYLMSDFGLSAGDFGRISSYGEVEREGTATVVLTDYGLSENVYSQHYSPSRSNRMYEEYSFNNKNYGLIPDGYGDDNNINWGFVEFVMNRNKYPKKPINNIHKLTEIFNSCVDNLKQILSNVNKPLEFYKNLITLQNYLLSNNLYDKDELILIENGKAKFHKSKLIDDDLEYNHATDPTKDEFELTERKKDWVKGAKGVTVKRKCRLGGKGNTSDACNQGDISNLEFSNLEESRVTLKDTDYQRIDDSDLIDATHEIEKVQRKIRRKEYLSDEDFDDILYYYYLIRYNYSRVASLWGDARTNEQYIFLTNLINKRFN